VEEDDEEEDEEASDAHVVAMQSNLDFIGAYCGEDISFLGLEECLLHVEDM
jgi:hypothetical protein